MGKAKAPEIKDNQKRDDKLVDIIGHDRRALGKDGEIELRSLNYGEFDGKRTHPHMMEGLSLSV